MRLSNGEVLLAWPLAQHIITQGDAKQVLALLDKLGVQGKATVEAVQDAT